MESVRAQKQDVIKFVIIFLIFCFCLKPIFANAGVSHKHIMFSSNTVSYTSVSLNAFIYQVLANNPSIQAAQANVAAAQARQNAAAQPLYNPELTGEAQQATDKVYAAGINQTVDWANKRNARSQVGTAEFQIAKAQLSVLRQQLVTEVLDAIARYQTEQQVVIFAKERTTLMQQFVVLTEKRHASGDVARVDVDLAKLALSESLAQQAEVEIDLNKALQTLQATTGLMRSTMWPSFPVKLPQLAMSSVDDEQLMNQLPVIQVLNNQYLSAQARIRLAEQESYPDPTFGIQGGKEDTNEGNSGLVGVTVSIPIFIRNNYHAQIDAANFDAIEAGQERMNRIRQIRAEIENSAKRYHTLYQSTQQWQQVSNQPLTDGMVIIEKLWQGGEINSTDYLVQVKQRIDSQIAGVELKGRTWQAWIDWLNASGTLQSWLQQEST